MGFVVGIGGIILDVRGVRLLRRELGKDLLLR